MRSNSLSRPRSNRGQVFRNSTGERYAKRAPRSGAYINPERFVNKAAEPTDQVAFVPTHQFSDFKLTESLQHNVTARGFTVPTPIQDAALPVVLEGRDLVGLANTGTGKTAVFLLPIINYLLVHGGRGHALIIAPTRELANQINDEFRAFARGLQLYSAICVGGASLHQQIMALNRRPQVVVGTPGRLKDLVQQGKLRLGGTNILVLDEADRMFDMGFIRDINFLVDQLPSSRQSLCFSATMPAEVKRLVDKVLINPETVSVKTSETSAQVEQDVIKAVSKDHKFEILTGLLRQDEFSRVMVFGQTKWNVQRMADNLVKQGISAEAIHGNKSQAQRERALRAFKDGKVRVLVATDVAARGLDIPDVSHVINFDQPATYDDYIHRIGRTGRAGKVGKALTFVS